MDCGVRTDLCRVVERYGRFLLVFLLWVPACGGNGDSGQNTDTDSGADGDTAADTDTDADSDGDTDFCFGPYRHVTPADVGVRIGVGVVGPMPTEPYGESTTITSPTTIENVVIDGCLRIQSDNVTLRNVIINCNGFYPVQLQDGSRNFTIEYSQLNCGNSTKVFYFQSGGQDATIAYNETIGCEDLFFLEGNLDGLEVRCNYMHTLFGTSESHADGFQIGSFTVTEGTALVRGNYFDPDNSEIGKTDLIYATNFSRVHLIFEDNYIEPWGHYTLRCGGESTQCDISHNVFSQAFSGEVKYLLLCLDGGSATFSCNRYADGELVAEVVDGTDVVLGVDHLVDDCPAF